MNFEHELKAICNTKGGPYLRPFRPNVAWAHSKAWIVGSNPATPLRQEFRSFDEYWDSLTKNPDVFERTYANARGDEDSKTTKRVKELCAELRGINYLVTNACAYPVAHNGRVPAEQWAIGEQIFRGLLICCEPKVIFAHGTKAQRLVERVFGVALDPYLDPDLQRNTANQCLLLCAPHLSGAGMRPGATFSADQALPKFAPRIRSAIVAQQGAPTEPRKKRAAR